MIHLCSKPNNLQDGDNFTLGAVLQTLSTLSKEKKIDIKSQNCTRENVVRVLNHQNCLYPRKSAVSSASIESLRKSLHQQVEAMKTKPKKSFCRVLKHGYHQKEKENLTENEPNFNSMLSFNKGKKLYTHEQEQDLEYVFLKNDEEVFDTEKDLTAQTPISRNIVYSRHLQNSTDVESLSSGNDDIVDIFSEENRRQRRKMRRASNTSSLISNTSGSSHNKERQSQNSSESIQNEEKVSVKIEQETDFVSGLSDQSLKDSMQKILQRRKSTLCLFKSAKGGIKVLNENETFSDIAEESSLHSDKSVSEFEAEKSVYSESAESFKSEFEYKIPSNIDENVDHNSLFVSTSNAHDTGKRKGILKNRCNQSARLFNTCDSAKTTYKTSKNKSKVETEETKTIRPLSVNVWRPSLVPKQTKKRSNTAYSCPETRKEKAKMSGKSKDDAIRDFIIMYAKVKNKNAKIEPEDSHREVRMVSETPEFVVKSAIGQFLSVPFPPERNTNCENTNEEKYEAKQRTRLLRIKNCMQLLANIA